MSGWFNAYVEPSRCRHILPRFRATVEHGKLRQRDPEQSNEGQRKRSAENELRFWPVVDKIEFARIIEKYEMNTVLSGLGHNAHYGSNQPFCLERLDQ